jgi:hypothetical protein
MADVLCTECGAVGAPKTAPQGSACAHCGGTLLLAADSPAARAFIDNRAALEAAKSERGVSVRAEATGKVLGRALGKLFRK